MESKESHQLTLSEDALDMLEKIQKDTEASSIAAVVGEAISLYSALRKQINDQFEIQAVKKTGTKQIIRELNIP